ncbi:MAG: chemotaxis protein CheX [Thermotogae bacterium]|nr:chemotaxis protein CheX [Thermotogota bacterium]
MEKDIERVVADFTSATVDVYRELTSLKSISVVKEAEKNEGNIITVDGCAVILGFDGGFDGRFLLNLPFSEALRLHEVIVGESVNGINDEVLFTVSEVGNMIAGNAVTRINDEFKGANIRLSPPSIFAGKDMKFFNFGTSICDISLKTCDCLIRINVAIKER